VRAFLCHKDNEGVFEKNVKRKGVSTSLIRSNEEHLHLLPMAGLYELTFFRARALEKVLTFLRERNASFGVHLPFVFRYSKVHPLPTSLFESERLDTFEVNLFASLFSRQIGAEYVVVHFPTAQQREDWLEDRTILHECVEHLVKLNEILPVRIENVYMNDRFHNSQDYNWLCFETNAKLCVDVGHLLIDSQIYGFDPVRFIDNVSTHVAEFHIYYADWETYRRCHHAPWGESRDFLRVLDFLRDFDADFVIEPSNDCVEGLEKLLDYWEGL